MLNPVRQSAAAVLLATLMIGSAISARAWRKMPPYNFARDSVQEQPYVEVREGSGWGQQWGREATWLQTVRAVYPCLIRKVNMQLYWLDTQGQSANQQQLADQGQCNAPSCSCPVPLPVLP